MKLSHIFLDLDNTIFDFTASSEIALAYVAKALKLPYDERFKSVYHRHNSEVWHLLELGLIDTKTLRTQRFEKTAEEFGNRVDGSILNRLYLSKLVENPRFIDGATELLTHLSQHYTLVATTNGLKEVQRPRLKKVGFDTYFDHIVVSDEIGVAKPSDQYFSYAWEVCGKPDKNKIIIIGDNPKSDIEGGRNFGIHTCLYDPDHKYLDIECTHSVDTLDALHTFL